MLSVQKRALLESVCDMPPREKGVAHGTLSKKTVLYNGINGTSSVGALSSIESISRTPSRATTFGNPRGIRDAGDANHFEVNTGMVY